MAVAEQWQCSAVQGSTGQCSAGQCSSVQIRTVPVQCSAVQSSAVQWRCSALHRHQCSAAVKVYGGHSAVLYLMYRTIRSLGLKCSWETIDGADNEPLNISLCALVCALVWGGLYSYSAAQCIAVQCSGHPD